MIEKPQAPAWCNKVIVSVMLLSVMLLSLLTTTWAQPSRQTRYLQFEPASGSCFDAVIYEPSGEVTPLPAWLQEVLSCGVASLSPDGRLLTYVTVDAVALFDLDTQAVLPVLDLPLVSDGGDIIRLENPPHLTWSARSDRLAVTFINTSDMNTYPTQVHVIDVDANAAQVTNARVFDIDVTFMCGNICFPLELALETHHLRYQTNSTLFYETGRRTMAWLELDPTSP
ncbi:MAG: hypothetical protein AAF708_18950 [Deinococcota bacterium]